MTPPYSSTIEQHDKLKFEICIYTILSDVVYWCHHTGGGNGMRFLKFTALLMCALLLAGCAQPQTQPTEGMTNTMQTQPTTQPELTDYDRMLERSILNMGNAYRLQQKIRAAQNGEDITIAYIGGSITEGPDVKPAERYVTLSYHEFEDAYCNGGKVTSINAGLSGTPSNLGVLRLQRDVLDHEPDIVFVEFAVNDSQDFQEKQCFESLIRTVLEQENEPAVVLIFNRTQDGYTCQSTMGLTGMYYSLPMISVNDAVTTEMEEGRLTWEEFSDDTVHPNAHGHRLTADFIAHMFRLADQGTWEEYKVPESKQFQAPFMNAVMITPESEDTGAVEITDLGSFTFYRGNRTGFATQWRCDGTEGFQFTVTGNAVFLIFNRNKTANMGSADVYINGEKAMTINACDPNGWGDPWSQMLVKSKTVETYEIEIRIAEGSEDKLFEIYGIAYSQNQNGTE